MLVSVNVGWVADEESNIILLCSLVGASCLAVILRLLRLEGLYTMCLSAFWIILIKFSFLFHLSSFFFTAIFLILSLLLFTVTSAVFHSLLSFFCFLFFSLLPELFGSFFLATSLIGKQQIIFHLTIFWLISAFFVVAHALRCFLFWSVPIVHTWEIQG